MNLNVAKTILEEGGTISPLFLKEEDLNGVGLCNPSIFHDTDGKILVNLRKVDYLLYHSEFNQKYYNYWGCLSYLNPEDDIKLKTTNFLGELSPIAKIVKSASKIDTSEFDVDPIWTFVGLEDGRLVRWDNRLFVIGVRRDTTTNGQGRMEFSEIVDGKEINRFRIQAPHPYEESYLEKNWMPILDMPYHFVRWTNPTEIVKVDLETETSKIVYKSEDKKNLPRELRGSSQVVPFGDYRIAITHEVDFWYNASNFKDSQYYHRFIVWDKDWKIVKLTEPFKFMDAQIEFTCGLSKIDNNFLISFGFQDNAAYILTAPTTFLDKLKWDNSSGQGIKWIDPKLYDKSKQLKVKFKGLDSVEKNYSQCYQDLFVLTCLDGKRSGTYIEVGAGDPFYGNNTALLEEFGWKGISVDLSTQFAEHWKEKRPNSKFLLVDATKLDIKQSLLENNLPTVIDYLQLDIDPSHNTLKVLENIDFDSLSFKIITYEHDYYVDENDEIRNKSREILSQNGYLLLAANISPDNSSPYEDWWINKKYLNEYNPDILTNIHNDVLFVEDYMLIN